MAQLVLVEAAPPSLLLLPHRLVQMFLPRPCVECQALTQPGHTRCPRHENMRRKVWDAGSVAVRKARIKGGGAAARLRRKLNKEGGGSCNHCRLFFPAAALHIDHRVALQNGGTDTDTNLQILCKPCHGNKTIEENQRRRSERQPQRR